MKKLGIIGGAGPLASALFYETLVQESLSQGKQVPEIFLINYPFTRGMSIEEGRDNELIIQEELQRCIQILVHNDVTTAVLICNTMHLYLARLPSTPIVFHHLPELVVKASKEKGHERLLILGTQNSCRSQLYARAGSDAIYPTCSGQKLIDAVIDHVLEGKLLQEDALLIGALIYQTLEITDFDGVVLGCTDLPVLHHHFPIPSKKPIYDSVKHPAQNLVGIL